MKGEYSKTTVKIMSKALREVLEEILGDVEDTPFDRTNPEVRKPSAFDIPSLISE
jgi:hypothetical protein